MSPVTPEELRTLHEENDRAMIESMTSLLGDCYSRTHVLDVLGIELEEVLEKIKSDELIAIEIDIDHWLPKWQFVEDENDELVPHPALIEAKKLWGNTDLLGFFYLMVNEEVGYSRTRRDILVEGNDEVAIREVTGTIKYHGSTFM